MKKLSTLLLVGAINASSLPMAFAATAMNATTVRSTYTQATGNAASHANTNANARNTIQLHTRGTTNTNTSASTPSDATLENEIMTLLHTRYCNGLTSSRRASCNAQVMSDSDKKLFHAWYTTWLDTIEADYRTQQESVTNEPVSTFDTSDMNAGTTSSGMNHSDSIMNLTNPTDWQSASTNMWQMKTGDWVKMQSGKLEWSTDGGLTWMDLPNGAWQADDSNWYMFDKSGNLQMSTNGGVNWTASKDNSWSDNNGNWYMVTNGKLMMRAGKTPASSPAFTTQRQAHYMQQDYEACRTLSPRRYASCLDDQRSQRETQDNMNTGSRTQ